jgi:hypothetical protein
MSELKEDKISILIELVASLNDRLTKLEEKVNGNSLSKIIDTENYSKISQPRSPSLGSIGEKVDEEETLSNTEDIIKEKIRKAVDHIIAYSKEVPYIMNK